MIKVPKPIPPDEAVLLEVVECIIDGNLGAWPGQLKIDILWRLVQPGVPVTFWARNLDWLPDVNTQYLWDKQGYRLATP